MKMVSVNKLNNSVRNAKFAELSRKKINFLCCCINVLNDWANFCWDQGPRGKSLSGGTKQEFVDEILGGGGMLGNFYLISQK